MRDGTMLTVDYSNLFYRCAWALGYGRPDGPNHRAVAQSIDRTLASYMRDLDVPKAHVEIALDGANGRARRQAILPEYKGSRTPEPWVSACRAYCTEQIRSQGFAVWDFPDEEADDVLAALARAWGNDENGPATIWIASGDKDLLGTITARVGVYQPSVTKGRTPERRDLAWFTANFGFTPDMYPFYKALMGDKSDNIFGVPKVGEKTAQRLVREYGTLDNLLASIGPVREGIYGVIADHADRIRRNLTIVTLRADLDLWDGQGGK